MPERDDGDSGLGPIGIPDERSASSEYAVTQRTHTIIHCANLCLGLGRKLQWGLETERFVGDDEANSMSIERRRDGTQV